MEIWDVSSIEGRYWEREWARLERVVVSGRLKTERWFLEWYGEVKEPSRSPDLHRIPVITATSDQNRDS